LALESLSTSDEPRHSRLRRAMLNLMADRHWLPGDKLPPEKEIADAVGLSLGTVQKSLVQTGGRQRGRAASMVTGRLSVPSSQAEQLLHFRFIGDDGVCTHAGLCRSARLHAVTGRWPVEFSLRQCAQIHSSTSADQCFR
jgi:DNA-binding transcriptional MocR family regulator